MARLKLPPEGITPANIEQVDDMMETFYRKWYRSTKRSVWINSFFAVLMTAATGYYLRVGAEGSAFMQGVVAMVSFIRVYQTMITEPQEIRRFHNASRVMHNHIREAFKLETKNYDQR